MFFIKKKYIDGYASLSKKEQREAEHNIGRELCSEALLEHFGISSADIVTNENGKPYLSGNEAYFNISHSCGAVICAVSDKPIGIDIEYIDHRSSERLRALANRYFTKNEAEYFLKSGSEAEAFYRIWTRKEAYCKLHGFSLADSLSHDTVNDKTSTYTEDGFVISIASE